MSKGCHQQQETSDDNRSKIDTRVVVTQQPLQLVAVLLVARFDDAFYLTTATTR